MIRLHGELGERYGREHKLSVKSAAEAVRALMANFPGFDLHLVGAEERGVVYQVTVDDYDLDDKELTYPVSKEIHFTPVIRGASTGTAKIIVGAVLVVAGIVLGAFTFGGSSVISAIMINAGVGLMLGGAIQLLTPVPKSAEPGEAADNKPSYVFDGPVNTTAQGQPVPIGYGRLIVGGAVISAGIQADDLISPSSPPIVVYSK